MYTPFVWCDFLMLLIEIPVHIVLLVLLEDDLFMLVCKLRIVWLISHNREYRWLICCREEHC